jgi:hypothetical protein
MKLDSYTAVGLCEGFIEAESEEQVIAAWQYLHDTGMAYTLQGWFGRQAAALLEAGVIVDNRGKQNDGRP